MTPTEFDDFCRELKLKMKQACSMRTVSYIHVTDREDGLPWIILCNSKTVTSLCVMIDILKSVMIDILRGYPPQVDIVTA